MGAMKPKRERFYLQHQPQAYPSPLERKFYFLSSFILSLEDLSGSWVIEWCSIPRIFKFKLLVIKFIVIRRGGEHFVKIEPFWQVYLIRFGVLTLSGAGQDIFIPLSLLDQILSAEIFENLDKSGYFETLSSSLSLTKVALKISIFLALRSHARQGSVVSEIFYYCPNSQDGRFHFQNMAYRATVYRTGGNACGIPKVCNIKLVIYAI